MSSNDSYAPCKGSVDPHYGTARVLGTGVPMQGARLLLVKWERYQLFGHGTVKPHWSLRCGPWSALCCV